jgi:hypothetical protein
MNRLAGGCVYSFTGVPNGIEWLLHQYSWIVESILQRKSGRGLKV